VRKRAAKEPVEVSFLTDPLCPWSWAMEPFVTSLRSREDLALRSVLTGWLPSLAANGVSAAKAEWAAAAKAGGRIDPAYWDRVAPTTSLIACAAVKAAELQGTAKGEALLAAIRRAAFEKDANVADGEAIVSLAASNDLKPDMFRTDLGIGRYTAEDVVQAIDPSLPLSESVAWFARRRMLRSWTTLAEDIRNGELQGLASPAFHILHGKNETKLKGVVRAEEFEAAIRTVL